MAKMANLKSLTVGVARKMGVLFYARFVNLTGRASGELFAGELSVVDVSDVGHQVAKAKRLMGARLGEVRQLAPSRIASLALNLTESGSLI